MWTESTAGVIVLEPDRFPDDRTYSSMSIQQIDNSISLLINKFRQETKKNNGIPASRSQVWMAAYMKDGTSNSDSVNEVMTQMNELTEHMEGSSTDPAALQEQIFTQVMGPERPGRVQMFGLGPSPTDVFGGGYRRSQEQNRLFQTQVQEQVQEQLHRYQMQFESKMNEVMEKQIQAIRTDFQSRIQFLESQLQAAGVPVDPVVAPSNPLHRQQGRFGGVTPNEFAISLIFELKIYLDILYEIGARQFIVNNIGPLGCLPSLRYKTTSGQCNEDMNNLIMPYNYRLPKWLKTWTHYDYSGSGITFVLADSYGLLNHMVYHPQEFGFKDVKHPCCGQDVNGELECPPNATPCSNRDEYLFFDGAHTSQVANLEFALLCANATICRVIE
ncbi:uncharacterized protein LOC114323231 [Camellia sinensis]|uniref:uncharacterized protein LOC114323231 n=1 Tax=Camellia sinensis TaxID=4442 RepID=UPI0010356EC9|nr:uncharacterized protein LOC114323231 [Camellia sinensis]